LRRSKTCRREHSNQWLTKSEQGIAAPQHDVNKI